MRAMLLRLWQWLGRLLGVAPPGEAGPVSATVTVPAPVYDDAQRSATAASPVASPPAPVALPPPPPPQLDLHTNETPRFWVKSSLLTRPEGQFYRSLLRACGQTYQAMPKVRLWDFIYLANDPPERKQHLSRLSCRHVDFLLCEPLSLRPLLVIELDDRSHTKPEAIAADRYKDELFAAAGLPLLRFDHANYAAGVIRRRIEEALDSEPQP